MKKALKILVLVFVISVLAMTVVACDVDCPNGHTWDGGTVTKQPTCTEAGERTYTCAVCGTTRTAAVEALGHSYNYVPEVPADCKTAGTAAHYTCSRCDKLFVSQNGEMKQVTAEELVVTADHSWDSGIVTKYPTCTEAGEKTYTCLSCGETKTEAVAATGHDYGDEIAEVPATCTTQGTAAHYECANCHNLFVDAEGEKTQVTVAEITLAPAHSFDDGVVTTQPTCQATGIKTYTCSACHATHTELVPATGHDYGDEITEVPSTCTTQGTAAHYQCASCGKLFVDDNGVKKEVAANELVIALVAHSYDEGTVTTQPTCEKDGVKTFACTACGHTYTEKVAATGHNYGEEIAEAAATCTATGTKAHYECANCGKLFVDVNGRKIQVTENYLTIALVPHTVVTDEAVEPTCTATGLTEGKKCSVCGEILTAQEEIPAKGHSYDNGVVTTQPTCTEKGEKTFTCTVCGATKTEEVAELGHDIVHHEAKTPTCTEKGWEAYDTCSRCGYTTYKEIEAKGHTEEVMPAVEPTCTEAGTEAHYECSTCHTLFVDKDGVKTEVTAEELVIAAKGHSYGELITEVAATCTTAGTKAHYKCSACDTLFVEENGEKKQVTAEDLAIPATGHTYNAAETHSNKCVNCDNEITFEEIVAIIKGLANKEETTDTYLLKGVVTDFDSFHNPYITVEGTSDTVLCYYLHEGTHDEVTYYPDDLEIGYTITVVGPLKKFNPDLEIEDGNLIGAISPQRTVTLEAVTNGTVDVVGEGSFPTTAHDGDKISFTVTANDGYKVASVTVNGTAITADADGTYTATVNGNTTIKVEIVEDSVVVPEAELVLTLTAETMEMNSDGYADNNGDHVVGEYTVTSNQVYKKNGGTDLQWQKNNGSLTLTGTFCKVIINYTQGSYTLTVNNKPYSGTTANGQIIFDFGSDITGEYIIKVGNATGYVSSIEFYAMPACAHEVDNWSPNYDGTHSGECTICGETVTEDCTYQDGKCTVCEAAQPSHSITVEIANGRVTAADDTEMPSSALVGTNVSFKVIVNDGYVLSKVIVDGEEIEATNDIYTITVNADVTITVEIISAASAPVATFTLGNNGATSHYDGTSAENEYTESNGGYTLKLTGLSNVYKNARDDEGNGCLKLGTGSKTGKFTFTVADDVKTVKIYVAKYKANKTSVTINGTTYDLTKNSSDGEYDCIEIDVSSNKTITLESNKRCMVNTIEFYA